MTDSCSQPTPEPVRHDDPRCDCGHLFEMCNSPNYPRGDEYAIIANDERNRFTSRMMSNLDGGQDAEIAALTARVAELEAALQVGAAVRMQCIARAALSQSSGGAEQMSDQPFDDTKKLDIALAQVSLLRTALEIIEGAPISMVNDSESLRHTIKSLQATARYVLSRSSGGARSTSNPGEAQ